MTPSEGKDAKQSRQATREERQKQKTKTKHGKHKKKEKQRQREERLARGYTKTGGKERRFS